MDSRSLLDLFHSLQPGDNVEIKHEVKVGFNHWTTTTLGKVISVERRRHGLHHRRAHDDKVYSDTIILEKEGGERTTIALDEFSELRRVASA